MTRISWPNGSFSNRVLKFPVNAAGRVIAIYRKVTNITVRFIALFLLLDASFSTPWTFLFLNSHKRRQLMINKKTKGPYEYMIEYTFWTKKLIFQVIASNRKIHKLTYNVPNSHPRCLSAAGVKAVHFCGPVYIHGLAIINENVQATKHVKQKTAYAHVSSLSWLKIGPPPNIQYSHKTVKWHENLKEKNAQLLFQTFFLKALILRQS